MLFQMLACLLAIKHDTAVITPRVRLEKVRYITCTSLHGCLAMHATVYTAQLKEAYMQRALHNKNLCHKIATTTLSHQI